MREKKTSVEAAAAELERRSRYLSSLIQKTKLKTVEEEEEKETGKEEVDEEDKEDEGGPQEQQNVKVRASDMAPAMQRRAFRCARGVLAAMPKLDSRRLALTLKKISSMVSLFPDNESFLRLLCKPAKTCCIGNINLLQPVVELLPEELNLIHRMAQHGIAL